MPRILSILVPIIGNDAWPLLSARLNSGCTSREISLTALSSRYIILSLACSSSATKLQFFILSWYHQEYLADVIFRPFVSWAQMLFRVNVLVLINRADRQCLVVQRTIVRSPKRCSHCLRWFNIFHLRNQTCSSGLLTDFICSRRASNRVCLLYMSKFKNCIKARFLSMLKENKVHPLLQLKCHWEDGMKLYPKEHILYCYRYLP